MIPFYPFLTDDNTRRFVDSEDQDQTTQNVQSDLRSTPSTFLIDYNLTVTSFCNGSVFLANEKA